MTELPRFKAVFLKESGSIPVTLNVTDDLDILQEMIGCDCIDIARRYIGNVEYRVIVDDCGLLKGRRPTAYGERTAQGDYMPVLVGSLIITKYNGRGDAFRDLTDSEIKNVFDNIMFRNEDETAILVNVTGRPPRVWNGEIA